MALSEGEGEIEGVGEKTEKRSKETDGWREREKERRQKRKRVRVKEKESIHAADNYCLFCRFHSRFVSAGSVPSKISEKTLSREAAARQTPRNAWARGHVYSHVYTYTEEVEG